jgi:hypothetical protein
VFTAAALSFKLIDSSPLESDIYRTLADVVFGGDFLFFKLLPIHDQTTHNSVLGTFLVCVREASRVVAIDTHCSSS